MPDRVRDAAPASASNGWNLRLRAFSTRGLAVAAGTAALVLLANVPLNRRNTKLLADHGAALIHSYRVMGQLGEVLSLSKDAETGVRGFVIAGDSSFLEPFHTAVRELPKQLDRLDTLTGNDSIQRANLPVLRARAETHMRWLVETARLRGVQGMTAGEARVSSGDGKRQMDALREHAAQMRAHEEEVLQVRAVQAADAYRQVYRSGLLAALAAFLSFVALMLIVRWHFKARAAALEDIVEQRAYFENTLRSIDDAVITTDERGQVSGLNAAAARLTGWTEGEASGRALDSVLVMRDAAGGELPDASMPTNPGVSAPLVVVETRNGGKRLAELRQSAIRNGEHVQVGSVVVLADVTESLEAKAQLEESDYRLRSALRVAGMFAWEIDIASTRVSLSDNAASLLGLVEGQRIDDVASALRLGHPSDLGVIQKALAATMETGERLEIEVRIVRPIDGAVRWVQVRGDAVRDERQVPLRVVGMLLDITERKQAQEDVARLSALLHAINEVTPDYVYSKDLAGRLTYANGAVCRGIGKTLDELLGKTSADLQPNEAQARAVMENDQRVMENGQSLMVDEVADLPSGRHWFYSAKMPQRDASGALVGLIGVSRDITERKRSEEALMESEGRFRAMAESAPVMIWLSDASGAITYTNAQWRTFVGLDRAAPMDITRSLHSDDSERFEQMMAQLPGQRGPVTLEFRVCRADSRFRWMLCTATPRLSETGAFLGGIGSILDIEERKVLENDLRMLAADLSAADRRKDEFLATLAHELRNPLAPIRNGLEILRLALPPNDTIDRTRGMMERQLVQIVRLVDDLLDISRISSGKLSLQRVRIDLRDAIALAIEATAASRSARSQRLIYEPQPIAIPVDGDLLRLGQVFTNLLDNASKYSPPHGLVWLSVHPNGTSVEVRVRDRGQGIPHAMLNDVFEMFIQVDRSLERAQGGLGIGLTLVKRLIEMHGGTVLAHSDGANQGSEFAVKLPLVSDTKRALLEGTLPERTPGEPAQTILIADDNVDGAATLAMLLTARGHHVEIANDGLTAVALAERMHPTLVLLDIGMPGLNGYEVCQRLRATSWGEHATIVALTGWGQDHDRRRSAEAGFDHHIVKPVDPAALERLVQRVHLSAGSRATE